MSSFTVSRRSTLLAASALAVLVSGQAATAEELAEAVDRLDKAHPHWWKLAGKLR